jgi:hypothetical protein
VSFASSHRRYSAQEVPMLALLLRVPLAHCFQLSYGPTEPPSLSFGSVARFASLCLPRNLFASNC